jgi:hypothetical protein
MTGLPKIARFTRLQSSILLQSKFKTQNWKRFGVSRMIDAFTTSFTTTLPRRRMVGAPFARLIANVIVMGGGVLGRAFLDAYKQALSKRLGSLASGTHAICTRALA